MHCSPLHAALFGACVSPPPPPREGGCYRGSFTAGGGFLQLHRSPPVHCCACRHLTRLELQGCSSRMGDSWQPAEPYKCLRWAGINMAVCFVFLGGGGTDTVWNKAWSHGAKHGIVEWDAQPQRLKDKGNWNRVMHTAAQRAIFQAYCSISELQRLN